MKNRVHSYINFGPLFCPLPVARSLNSEAIHSYTVSGLLNFLRRFTMTFLVVVLSLSINGAMAMVGTEKYENYLNELKTLAGDFTQVNSQGKTAQGKIQISRPGRMRLAYAPPSSLLIVADGKW